MEPSNISKSVYIYDVEGRNTSNQKLKLKHILSEATNISYDLVANSIYTASFDLPQDSVENKYINQQYYIEIYDFDERVELFRLVTKEQYIQPLNSIPMYTYKLEHVVAELADIVIPGKFKMGLLENDVNEEVKKLLASPYTYENKYEKEFEYQELQGIENETKIPMKSRHWVYENKVNPKFVHFIEVENANLLNILAGITEYYTEFWYYEYDTTKLPFKITVKEMGKGRPFSIRDNFNISTLRKNIDYSQIYNIITAKTAGDWPQTATVYNLDSIQEFGEKYSIVEQPDIVSNNKKTERELLRSKANEILKYSSRPTVSFEVDLLDTYLVTNEQDRARPKPGQKAILSTWRFLNDKNEYDYTQEDFMITEVSKPNIQTVPFDITVKLVNRPEDITQSLQALAEKRQLQRLQASAKVQNISYSDRGNMSRNNPLKTSFYIPDNCKSSNEIIITVARSELETSVDSIKVNRKYINDDALKVQGLRSSCKLEIKDQEIESTTTDRVEYKPDPEKIQWNMVSKETYEGELTNRYIRSYPNPKPIKGPTRIYTSTISRLYDIDPTASDKDRGTLMGHNHGFSREDQILYIDKNVNGINGIPFNEIKNTVKTKPVAWSADHQHFISRDDLKHTHDGFDFGNLTSKGTWRGDTYYLDPKVDCDGIKTPFGNDDFLEIEYTNKKVYIPYADFTKSFNIEVRIPGKKDPLTFYSKDPDKTDEFGNDKNNLRVDIAPMLRDEFRAEGYLPKGFYEIIIHNDFPCFMTVNMTVSLNLGIWGESKIQNI